MEYEPLHKEEIYTQCNAVVMRQDGCWYGHCNEGWSAWCSFGPGHFSFEDSNVGAIDKECSFGVVWCHRTVPNEVLSEDGLELDLIRPPNFSVKILASSVNLISRCENIFVVVLLCCRPSCTR